MNRTYKYFIYLSAVLAGCRGQPTTSAYVGGSTCVGCHEDEARLWRGSDHDRAMEVASDSTVLGDFDNTFYSQFGDTTRFFTRDGEYYVEVEDSGGVRDTFNVAYTFGIRPLQQYLVPTELGRFQALTVAWDTEENRWFSLYPEDRVEPGEFVHWSGRGMTWNYMCAECHSTRLRKTYDLQTDTYSTTFSEIDVSCEACHGPGEKHNELAKANEEGSPWPDSTYGLTVIMRPERSPSTEIEVCAPCHSRRTTLDNDYIPGERYLDHYAPALLDEGLYFADGQIDDEVYVYGSFTQSKMYRWGIRCSNCHDIHSGKLRFEGNFLCAQCHDQEIYDTPRHLQHKPETQATQCVTCHMPERTYMQVDPRRDHSMILPRPASARRFGVPDVCVACHDDRSIDQLYRDLDLWRADTTVVNQAPVIMADAISRGRAGDSSALIPLQQIIRDTTYSPIIRATATSLLGSFPVEEVLGTISRGLRADDPLVRFGALRAADALGPAATPALISPLVQDSIRWIRAEAARLLVMIGAEPADESIEGFEPALDEYKAMQHTTEDQPGAHLNLAVISENLGDDEASEASYRAALRRDSTFTPAHLNLGLLYNRQKTEATRAGNLTSGAEYARQAEIAFEAAIRTGPDSLAYAHYMLGLLLAENRTRLPDAAFHLELAAGYERNNPRMFYNAGLAYQQLGNTDSAERLLRHASELEPINPDFMNALVILYMQQELWESAFQENQRMSGLIPGNSDLETRSQYLRDQIDGSNE